MDVATAGAPCPEPNRRSTGSAARRRPTSTVSSSSTWKASSSMRSRARANACRSTWRTNSGATSPAVCTRMDSRGPSACSRRDREDVSTTAASNGGNRFAPGGAFRGDLEYYLEQTGSALASGAQPALQLRRELAQIAVHDLERAQRFCCDVIGAAHLMTIDAAALQRSNGHRRRTVAMASTTSPCCSAAPRASIYFCRRPAWGQRAHAKAAERGAEASP
jgi:hypothetical protein